MSYQVGQKVLVFYRMDKEDPGFMAVQSRNEGIFRPRMGMTDGWMPATIVRSFSQEAYDPQHRSTWVHFQYQHKLFYNREGVQVDETEDMNDITKPDYVRSWDGPLEKRPFVPALRPKLGVVVFRWGGRNEVEFPSQWGETGCSTSDRYIQSFFDRAVYKNLGLDWEVWSVFIETSEDLEKVATMAHAIFNENHPIRRCEKVVAFYHLYPTMFRENSIPFVETGAEGAGFVHAPGFFKSMRAIEQAGLPSKFPHPANLYEMLVAKSWAYYLSPVGDWKVPATCSPTRIMIDNDAREAARRTIASLEAIKTMQGTPGKVTKGVCKLGYSWEALDVKFWEGEEGLVRAFRQLLYSIYICRTEGESAEPIGQSHDSNTFIVQEYIKHEIEMRVYVVEGKIEATVYTKFCHINSDNDFKEFKQLQRDEACEQWMYGDREALEDAELQAKSLIDKWMIWMQAQTCEPIPAIRFDIFLCLTGPATAEIRLAEICELGFCMLMEGNRRLPNKVFEALYKSCMGESPVDAYPSLADAEKTDE